MRWFFGSRMSAADKKAGLALIRHLQKMLAYQQLALEGYNDALSFAAGMETLSNEGLPRALVPVSDPFAVREHVLPALRAKEEILQMMETEHSGIESPIHIALKRAYDDFNHALRVMQERALLQYNRFVAWIEDQSLTLETSQLDAAEAQAMTQGAASLTKLIRQVGLDTDAWLDVNRDAFNSVRETVGLSPMSSEEFRGTYLSAMAGRPARFFAR